MLDEKTINAIEKKLKCVGGIFYSTQSETNRGWAQGYCQGMAYVLDKLGYDVTWDDAHNVTLKPYNE